MYEAWPDIYNQYKFQIGPSHKIWQQNDRDWIKDPPKEHPSNNSEDYPNPHKNNSKVCKVSFEFEEKSMETESTIWLEFLKGVKATAKQILGILSALDETVSKTVHSKDGGDW